MYPRCFLLPSPERLDEEAIGSAGSDKTATLRDFNLFYKWIRESEFMWINHQYWFSKIEDSLRDDMYYIFISNVFCHIFRNMRHTASPELEELVFWCYSGHGLGKESAEKLSYSSTPTFPVTDLRYFPGHHDAANDFVKEGRKVKGGELCLHQVGFCGLHGMLKPWIASVMAPSENYVGHCRKKNKHLAIILDSCHSGIIAEELKDFEQHMNKQYPNFLQENSVTIQAACGPDQRTFGGYFTPCFVYLNDPKNAELLKKLEADWTSMTEEEQKVYKLNQLPCPMVVTTRRQPQDVTWELEIQNWKMTLFPDSGFFKFCSMKVYQHQDDIFFVDKDRALDRTSKKKFMESPFKVLDYKLKKYQGHPHRGTPMGLFLLKDRKNAGYTVCAHIHFKRGNTSNPQRINLVHHKKQPVEIIPFIRYEFKVDGDKFQVPSKGRNAKRLVKACKDYVEKKEPGRWDDYKRWDMLGEELGVNGLFKVKEQQKQRSAWEGSYLKHIEKYDLPKVANN